jgi:phosphoenolpyruvate synthase/pyruvate phosphate dikinase
VERPANALVEWLSGAGDDADVRAETHASGSADVLGGKGASLDRLGRFGFRIPPGFCLTTAAFRVQLESLPEAAGVLARLTTSGDLSLGDELAGILTTAPLIPPLAAALDEALAVIEDGAVARSGRPARLAVRSSAIGEDSAGASYAGLHETELDRSIAEVRDAVRRCWASLWSRPALAYRVRRGLPLDGAAMAVVVQELVPADAAAVAFTRHPVTGREDQLVLTAVRGLGDAMVSGTITPDTYIVDRASRRVLELTPGDDIERPLDAPALDALVELILEVERRFGAPVDIEAAMAAGTWYLLQARPITTGAPAVA